MCDVCSVVRLHTRYWADMKIHQVLANILLLQMNTHAYVFGREKGRIDEAAQRAHSLRMAI